MIVCVTGGRDFNDYDFLRASLDGIHIETPITLITNGAMIGADAWSSYWAYERKVDTLPFGAMWGKYGTAAGPKRNLRMLEGARPDLVTAFPTPRSRGTWDCVEQARRMKIPFKVFNDPLFNEMPR